MTLTQKINERNTLAFRRQLLQRVLEDRIAATTGEHYLYTDGYTVKTRKATKADVETVNTALAAVSRRMVRCHACGLKADSVGKFGDECHIVDPICCEVAGIPSARCQHLTTVANTAGSPVCQECGQSW